VHGSAAQALGEGQLVQQGPKLTTKVHAREAEKGKQGRGRSSTRTIATAAFSIPAGKTSIVRVQLNAAGRSLLVVHHGRLTVNLTILQSSPGSSHARTEPVHLARQKARARSKPGQR
jgi:hypothetical protein